MPVQNWNDPLWWQYCYDILRDKGWCYRRIDSLSLLDGGRTLLSTTINIDPDCLAKTASCSVFKEKDRMPLPVLRRIRAPLVSMEVKLNGRSQTIWNNQDTILFAFSVLLHFMDVKYRELKGSSLQEEEVFLEMLKGGVYANYNGKGVLESVKRFSSSTRDTLGRLKCEVQEEHRQGSSAADRLPNETLENTEVETELFGKIKLGLLVECLRLLDTLLMEEEDGEDQEVFRYLRELENTYIVLAWIDIPSKKENLFLTAEVVGISPNLRPSGFLAGSYDYTIPASQINPMKDKRYHLKVSAPAGTRIMGILTAKDGKTNTKTKEKGTDYGELGISGDLSTIEIFASVYEKSISYQHRHDVIVKLAPLNRIFLFSAMLTCLVLPVLLLSTYETIRQGAQSSNPLVILPIVALLPSIAFLFHRETDHELVNKALMRDRIVLFVVVFSSWILMAFMSVKGRIVVHGLFFDSPLVYLLLAVAILCTLLIVLYLIRMISIESKVRKHRKNMDRPKSWNRRLNST